MSPYGVDKNLGGDNPSNDSFMEKCVAKVTGTNKRTGKPYTEGEKIAICKTQLKSNKAKSSVLPEEVEIDEFSYDALATAMNACMREQMAKGKSNQDAKYHCDAKLSKSNYDIYKMFLLEDI